MPCERYCVSTYILWLSNDLIYYQSMIIQRETICFWYLTGSDRKSFERFQSWHNEFVNFVDHFVWAINKGNYILLPWKDYWTE